LIGEMKVLPFLASALILISHECYCQESSGSETDGDDGGESEENKERTDEYSYEPPPPPVDLYCGDQNCYDLLGVTRDDDREVISKAYRKLAGKWHPDRHRGEEEKKNAEQVFMKIAAGYEVLRDDDSRAEYDYMLDHPEEMMMNYYRYYKRRLAPKVDVRIVVLALVTVVSMVQYYSSWYNFEQAINHLSTVPKYRYQALEIAKEKGKLGGLKDKKETKGMKKDEIKKREEEIVREIIADMMDSNGGYQRPEFRDILWIQILLLPSRTYAFLSFHLAWLWKFGILREEYGEEEKNYVIRKRMKLTERQWEATSLEEKSVWLERKLWEKEHWEIWEEEREEQERIKAAQSGRSKQERRWLKNSDNRMTFDENYDW